MRMESGMRFAGKRAVVTRGASGIGRATALRLVEEGAEVLVGAVDEAGGAAHAQGACRRITLPRTDVTKVAAISPLSATADAAARANTSLKTARTCAARAATATTP